MEEVTLIWAGKAKEQTRDIYGYLYDGSVTYAASWVDEIERKLENLLKFPEMGRIVPEFSVSFMTHRARVQCFIHDASCQSSVFHSFGKCLLDSIASSTRFKTISLRLLVCAPCSSHLAKYNQ